MEGLNEKEKVLTDIKKQCGDCWGRGMGGGVRRYGEINDDVKNKINLKKRE